MVASFTGFAVTNAVGDTTAPTFASAAVDGKALTVTFSEPLHWVYVPAPGDFHVTVGTARRNVASGSVRIAGATVRLTLASAVLLIDTVKVRYTKPSWNALRDGAGNKVATFADQSVTNNTAADTTAPSPQSAVVSTVESGGNTYSNIVIDFGEALDPALEVAGNNPSVAAFTVNVAGTDRTPSSVAVSAGQRQVSLVLSNNLVTAGQAVTVSYDPSQAGGDDKKLRDRTGNVVASFTGFAVTNAVGDTTAPTFASAAVDGKALTVTFSEPLHWVYVPAPGDFHVTVGTARRNVASGGVRIAGATVTLTLASAAASADTVKVRYTKPSTKPLQDVVGNKVETFADQSVTNNTEADTTAPSPQSAAVSTVESGGNTYSNIVIDFGEALDPALEVAGNNPSIAAFTVNVAGSDRTPSSVAVSAGQRQVTLILFTDAVTAGQAVTVSYDPSRAGGNNKKLRDPSGNEVASFTGFAVTNAVGDTTAPTFASAAVDGKTLTVTFSELLDWASVPAPGDFHVTVDTARRNVASGGVYIAGATVTLTLASAAASADTVKVRYTKPSTKPLQDVVGNKVETFADQSATNNTEAGGASGDEGPARSASVLSVADARANEATGASVDFEVSLSGASASAVTVAYATADGTATAGADYTATSGTLTFTVGESSKTVSVPVLEDALDEGEETFTLTLSNPTGATIRDGVATGTIANDDPLQKMWLSRFGRTVAGHVTDAVSDRLANPLAGAQVTVAGQRVDLAEAGDEKWRGEALTSVVRALGAPEAPAPEGGLVRGPGQAGTDGWPGTGLGARGGGWSDRTSVLPARSVTGRELLLGSAFHLAREGDGTGPGLAAWGRVTVGRFDGEASAYAGSVRIDGDVTTGLLGADAEWNRLLAGVALSVSEGEGSFAHPGVDSGTIESTMTAVSPYGRFMVTDRVSVWGLAGWGSGDMTIVQAANDRGQPERITRTDLEMRLAALGGRGALLEAEEAGGMDLGLKADAFWVETEAGAVSNEGGTTATASRVRLALEGSRTFRMASGGVLTPSVELALRHDGGDAETGTGVELGGRVAWEDPDTGLGVEARAGTLVTHEDSDYREWGASGSIRLAPDERGRGLSFRLAPTYGAASSGVERLWSARDARGLAPQAEFEAGQRLEGELGYGLGLLGDRFTGTPNLGFGLFDAAREYRIGWRLTSTMRGDPGFEVNLDATRREAANGNEPVSGAGAGAEHGVMLRAAIRW